MLNDLTKEQRKLADFMSYLSEKCYSAAWMEGLEYVLWNTLTTGQKKYGQNVISNEDVDQLLKLSKECNCWIYYDDAGEESAIDLTSWTKKFNQAISQNSSKSL